MMATPEQYARMSELLQKWDDEEDGPSNDCMQVSKEARPLAACEHALSHTLKTPGTARVGTRAFTPPLG